MPFNKIKSWKDKGKYRSESWKVYTEGQVKLYYATNWFKKSLNPKKKKKWQ